MKYKTKINSILTIVIAILFIGMTFSASTSQLTDNKKIKINSKKNRRRKIFKNFCKRSKFISNATTQSDVTCLY